MPRRGHVRGPLTGRAHQIASDDEGELLTVPLPELLDAKRLQAELGITCAAAEAIMRLLPVVQVEGLRKTYVRRSDVAAYLEAHTFSNEPGAGMRGPSVGGEVVHRPLAGARPGAYHRSRRRPLIRRRRDGECLHRHPQNKRWPPLRRALSPRRACVADPTWRLVPDLERGPGSARSDRRRAGSWRNPADVLRIAMQAPVRDTCLLEAHAAREPH